MSTLTAVEPATAVEDPQILHGDCLEVIQSGRVKAESVNLIFTSPPYADQRKNNYGGIHPDEYVQWFLPRAEALKKSLKPDGSFVLNIKEKAVGGQRHTYVLELILALKKQGWLWVEEYCWHKKNCYPGKWPNRFRDSWERLLHFTINKKFKMRQESVMVPMGDWKTARLRNLSKTDYTRGRIKERKRLWQESRKLDWARHGVPDKCPASIYGMRLQRPSSRIPTISTQLVHSPIHRSR